MKILLKGIKIYHKGSPLHLKKRNIFLRNGKIVDITTRNRGSDKVIDGSRLGVSIGWFDMWSLFGDPGMEYKEDLYSGINAAVHGGFTELSLLPNTIPPIESKNDITYLKSKAEHTLVNVHPIASVTRNIEGEELTEMIDMHHAGAVAFSDGIKPLVRTDMVLKALLYLKKYNNLLINRPEDVDLTRFGTMHEGKTSTMLGLQGMPRLAEEIAIIRDIQLLDYARGKLHFANISSHGSVDLIRSYKKKYNVSCDVAAHQLVFEDNVIMDFDTNYKVNPPFRTRKDINALIRGLKDGTIDVIVSAHNPQDLESKKLEFDLAEFGIIGLQTVFPVLVSLSGKLDLDLLLEKITVNPRNLLGLKVPDLDTGKNANLTVFDPGRTWVLNNETNQSRSLNSPFWGKKLKGKAVGVFNKGKYWFDDSLNIS